MVRKEHIARVFLLLVLPFIIGSAFMPHTEALRGESLTRPSGIQTSYLQTEEYEFSHVYSITQAPQQMSSLFPLANYLHFEPAVSYNDLQLCFQDTGSTLTYPDGTVKDPQLAWNVSLNDVSAVYVPSGSVNCTPAKANISYAFTWNAEFPMDSLGNANLAQLAFSPSVVVYTKVIMDYGILQGLACIPAFYLFVFYPAAGILKKIRHGLMEQ